MTRKFYLQHYQVDHYKHFQRKIPQHQTHESLPPTKPNNNETQYKNKNNCNQKQLYTGNLNTDVVKEGLNQLLKIRSMKYLQDTCSIKMPVNQKTERQRICLYYSLQLHCLHLHSYTEYVYIELIRLNGIESKGKEITIQDTASTRPQTNVNFKNSKRPQIVVYQYPKNQDKFGRRNTVPGQQRYTNVTRTPQEAPKKTTTNYSLVIKEIKFLSLATAILVELVKKDLRKMLMVQTMF